MVLQVIMNTLKERCNIIDQVSLITYKMLLLFEVIRTFRRLQQCKTFRSNCMFVFTYETIDLRS
jgi:hypothetical protein